MNPARNHRIQTAPLPLASLRAVAGVLFMGSRSKGIAPH
jgi:hypothetical protein